MRRLQQFQPLVEPAEERNLFRANAFLAALHLVTAAAQVVYIVSEGLGCRIPVFSALPQERLAAPVLRQHGSVPVSLLAPVFLLLAGLDHLVAATCRRAAVSQQVLLQRRNPQRWLQYAFSASLMHIHIALLCGSLLLHDHLLLFALSVGTMVCGYLIEEKPQGQSPFWLGSALFLVVWLHLSCHFATVATKSSAPLFVWSIFFGVLQIEGLFAVHAYLSSCRTTAYWLWRTPFGVEIGYAVLSLVAKQLLAWIHFSGSLNAC